MITKVFMHEDRADKILPIVLELLKDEEEKRIIGLELLDALAEDFGHEICHIDSQEVDYSGLNQYNLAINQQSKESLILQVDPGLNLELCKQIIGDDW